MMATAATAGKRLATIRLVLRHLARGLRPQADQSGLCGKEPTGVEVERPESGDEVNVKPLAPRLSGMGPGPPHCLGGNAAVPLPAVGFGAGQETAFASLPDP